MKSYLLGSDDSIFRKNSCIGNLEIGIVDNVRDLSYLLGSVRLSDWRLSRCAAVPVNCI